MAKVFRNLRDASRNPTWGKDLCPEQKLTIDEIRLGTELRIADATELMAKNHQELIDELDSAQHVSQIRLNRMRELERCIAGLRGYITKLRNK